MKTFLITGGAGFIGSHLCKRLLLEKHKIICVDNLITGNKKNIIEFENNPNFKFILHDISNHINIKENIDYVLHFASIASPKNYSKYPIKTLKVGTLGTHNCLGLAKQKKADFILASTSEIYGDPEVHPQKEDYWGHVNPIGPRGCYDESKRLAESLAIAYHNMHDINIKIIRIFNTYGPKMQKDDGRVVPNFINQALLNQPMTLYGDGSQTRSFCYINDLIEGIYKLINFKTKKTVVNLGNPKEITILELANKISKVTKGKSEIRYLNLPKDEPKRRKPDITKAKKIINFSPQISLYEGLQKTIKWFKTNN